MPIESRPPQPLQPSAYAPPGPEPLLFEGFQGLDTSFDRAGVPDERAYWLDGWMPLAKQRNLRTLYGVGPSLYVAGGGASITFFDFYNIGSTAYAAVFLSDGRVDQVQLSNNATVAILGAGSITSPSILNQGISQWGREYLIIASNQTNGYWLWNGSTRFGAGQLAPQVSVVAAGSGYVTAPTVIVLGGHGSGASVTVAINSLGQITSGGVVNPGSGYLATDTVIGSLTPAPAGGSGGSVVVVGTLTQFDTNRWSIASISITALGSLYANPTLVFSQVSQLVTGAGAAYTNAGSLSSVLLTYGGIYASSVIPTITIVDTPGAGSISLFLMPFGVQGSWVETYQSRVWIGYNATFYWSAPGSFFNFSTASGGGNQTSGSSLLKVGYVRGISANGFLYLIGDSSIDYISGVTTSGTPPTTTFTILNADPQVGTPYPSSVQLYGRNPMLANSNGVYVCYGADVRKVSDELDGVWNSVANFGGIQLASAHATIYARQVWMELFRLVDPVSGTTSNKVAMWDGKRWWVSSQDITLNYVKGQAINSVFTTYGTNGSVIYPLFQTASSAFAKTAQSKLWDAPGGYQFAKTVDRWWGVYRNYSTVAATLGVDIDSVLNNQGTLVQSTASYTIANPASTGLFVAGPQAVGQQGELVGMTLKTTAADMAIVSAMLGAQVPIYRG